MVIQNILAFLGSGDINEEIRRWRENGSEAALIDCRTPAEYNLGHIDGSVNIPLDHIEQAENKLPDKHAPILVYCQAGPRATQAASRLKRMNYTDVKAIGGINGYRGKLVR